jgi:hypothetical protein
LFIWGLMSYLCFLAYSVFKHVLTIWVTERVTFKRQELVTLLSTWVHPRFCGEVRVVHLFVFCFVLFIFVLCLVCAMLPVSLGCLFLVASSIFSNVYLQCRRCCCSITKF